MAERIFATGNMYVSIQQELQAYREEPDRYVSERHPLVSFVTLHTLAHDPAYAPLVSQPFLHDAFDFLACRLHEYGIGSPLDTMRVWIGVAAHPDANFFGGFYHPDQGYRYLQQIAVTSLSGALSSHPVDRMLRTLELLRAYVHDTLHHHTYRLFFPIPSGGQITQHFYRMQYGINFRRWDGQSYSARDAVSSTTTCNLGNIMEAATDRFAHEFVLALAKMSDYRPSGCMMENYLYRDYTGQLTPNDLTHLRAIEKGQTSFDVPSAFTVYAKNMRLFVQYVTLRYRSFLAEYDAKDDGRLHTLILRSMLSGKMGELCHYLDEIQGAPGSFRRLFKTSDY